MLRVDGVRGNAAEPYGRAGAGFPMPVLARGMVTALTTQLVPDALAAACAGAFPGVFGIRCRQHATAGTELVLYGTQNSHCRATIALRKP